MTARTVIAWVVAAVLGLALAAGITLAASQLSSQRVGLSGEPLSAGDRLVPRAQPRPIQRRPSHPSRPAHQSQPSQPSQSPSGDDAGDAGGDD
ncbi:MAG: hypothetical protein ACXVFN_21335 [Solirubrobacteraceae bacterium]